MYIPRYVCYLDSSKLNHLGIKIETLKVIFVTFSGHLGINPDV